MGQGTVQASQPAPDRPELGWSHRACTRAHGAQLRCSTARDQVSHTQHRAGRVRALSENSLAMGPIVLAAPHRSFHIDLFLPVDRTRALSLQWRLSAAANSALARTSELANMLEVGDTSCTWHRPSPHTTRPTHTHAAQTYQGAAVNDAAQEERRGAAPVHVCFSAIRGVQEQEVETSWAAVIERGRVAKDCLRAANVQTRW